MPAEFTMPQLSDTMTEGTVIKWRKKEGEKIKAGEVIAEIETDKAAMESEVFDSGTVAAILVQDGQKAKVGAVLAVIAMAGENVAEIKKKYATGLEQHPLLGSHLLLPRRTSIPQLRLQCPLLRTLPPRPTLRLGNPLLRKTINTTLS